MEARKLRVMKRWVGGQGGHYVYVLQQEVQDERKGYYNWYDVPLVDEDENDAEYE